MLKLMKLELRRNNIKTYITAQVISCLALTGFIYFIAYVAKVENEEQFQTYGNIFNFVSVMGIFVFTIFSAIMYSRLIIRDYDSKRLVMLFLYPVSREKVLFSKVLIVYLFTICGMFISTIVPVLVFSATENFAHMVHDVITPDLVLGTVLFSIFTSVSVGAFGIFAMRIGFIHKSVPTTLVSAFVLSGIYGNLALNLSIYPILLGGATVGILVVTLIVVNQLAKKIKYMEVF